MPDYDTYIAYLKKYPNIAYKTAEYGTDVAYKTAEYGIDFANNTAGYGTDFANNTAGYGTDFANNTARFFYDAAGYVRDYVYEPRIDPIQGTAITLQGRQKNYKLYKKLPNLDNNLKKDLEKLEDYINNELFNNQNETLDDHLNNIKTQYNQFVIKYYSKTSFENEDSKKKLENSKKKLESYLKDYKLPQYIKLNDKLSIDLRLLTEEENNSFGEKLGPVKFITDKIKRKLDILNKYKDNFTTDINFTNEKIGKNRNW